MSVRTHAAEPSVALTSAGNPARKTLKSFDWLVRDYAITVLPSVSSLKVLSGASAKSAAGKPMAGYGDPVFKKEGIGNGTRLAANRGYGNYFRGLTAAARRSKLPCADLCAERN